MNIIKNKLLIAILIVFSILAIGMSNVFAANPDYITIDPFPKDGEPNHSVYEGQHVLFCTAHGYITILADENGNPEDTMTLSNIENDNTIEPSAGYAFNKVEVDGDNYNNSINSLQHAVWMSRSWGNDSNVLQKYSAAYSISPGGRVPSLNDNINVEYRSQQYGTVYYNIFNKLNGSELFKTTTTESDLKVLVDQSTQTYTVGPYKLSLNVDGVSDEAKQILYNELNDGQGNQGYTTANAFAKMNGISGINGTDVTFVNLKGEKIAFPNFASEENFYIRFKPNNNGEISTTGVPEISVSYIDGFTANVGIYQVNALQYTYTFEKTEIDQNSVTIIRSDVEPKIDSETGKVVIDEDGNIMYDEPSYQEGVATLRGTLDLEGADGTKISVEVTRSGVIVSRNGGSGEWSLKYRTQSIVDVDTDKYVVTGRFQVLALIRGVKPVWKTTTVKFPESKVSEELGGNVWQDLPDIKTGLFTGVKGDEDKPYAGMLVQLFDLQGNLINTTTTDSNGKYHFTGLNPLKKYYVKFIYNGQIYQSTYYKYQLTGGYSNAAETEREALNAKFEKIDSTSQNYKTNLWNKSYALEAKLAQDSGEYIAYNGGALTYQDAWNKFVELATNNKEYTKSYVELDKWLLNLGVGKTDRTGVVQYIKDCMITSTTYVLDPLSKKAITYPVYDQFVLKDINNPPDEINTITLDKNYYYLYTKKSDQSRYVDFGIVLREQADLAIQKDVYKATLIVNGKKQEYKYSKKDGQIESDGSWDITVRASDELYNGSYTYSREVRKSEYLYNGSSVGTDDTKNLQVYVTYRLAIKNQGTVNTTVNELVDYYDASQYDYDGILQSNGVYSNNVYNTYDSNGNVTGNYVNSYVGDRSANKTSDIIVSSKTSESERNYTSKILTNGEYTYNSLYITGIKTSNGNTQLAPGELAYAYVTFKVKNDSVTGKVKLDEDLTNGNETIGKRNLIEINGYSTYYANGATIPSYLGTNNELNSANVAGKAAGIIDKDSNAGSLATIDLNNNGDIRTSSDNAVENRAEDDTDKAPNIKVIIERNPSDDRTVSGYTYDDARTNTNDSAVVGNGTYNEADKDANGNKETKISGVTVQLVELVQNVDSNGISLGTYKGEHVWSSMTYDLSNKTWTTDNTRYYSGNGRAKVILSGTGILSVDSYDIGDGEYAYTSLPAGDFFIRFIYGDTEQTVLLNNSENEVNKLLGKAGLNEKSYNGQDYKSTVYQSGVSTDGSYNGINGYTDKEGQNYTNADGTINNGTEKSSMYWYNIEESSKVQGVSDAKDVYLYRDKVNNYSKTLLNNKAEILDSFEKLSTYAYTKADGTADTEAQKENQQAMINELINNTQMVAQSGVIDTEIEYNTRNTDNQGNANHIEYKISDVDLGLQERPEAQLKLTKEVSNFKIVLANNQALFDTNQSVNNLYYAKHTGHKTGYLGFRMTPVMVNQSNTTEKPELIQGYVDDELMEGSTLRVTYKFTITNVGEVDYLDKTFYYTGKTNNTDVSNISKTNANSMVDYVSNMIKYDKSYQDANTAWDIRNAEYLTNSTTKTGDTTNVDNSKIASDIVNRQYYNELLTYNTMLTTNKLSTDLLPTCLKNNDSISTTLVVSTLLSSNNDANNMVYNNLSEIVQTTNTQGRRMQYSISGNQEMADQSLGGNAKTSNEGVYTTVDLITPSEIDADSAQKILLLPPTGANKNYLPIIITSIAAIILIAGTIFIIKKKIIK